MYYLSINDVISDITFMTLDKARRICDSLYYRNIDFNTVSVLDSTKEKVLYLRGPRNKENKYAIETHYCDVREGGILKYTLIYVDAIFDKEIITTIMFGTEEVADIFIKRWIGE